MSKSYAGIGSRATPKGVLLSIQIMGAMMAGLGYTLRSGGASGADKAFESGCDKAKGKKEIYLPWKGFEGSNSNLIVNNPKAFEVSEKYHPYWHNLSQGARRLQARNAHQVLGLDLKTPCDFIICYTRNGLGKGGTGQALRIAQAYDIPIFDLGKYDSKPEMISAWMKFIEDNCSHFALQ